MANSALNESLHLAESALTYLNPDDYSVWINAGMALKSSFGDSGFPIWSGWSQGSPKFKEHEAEKKWLSFNSAGITVGSLIYEAKQNGFRNVAPAKPISILKNLEDHSKKTKYAKELWDRADASTYSACEHPYMKSKELTHNFLARRVKASGMLIGQLADCIILPIRCIKTDLLTGVECINQDGIKQTFGRKNDGALILGNTLQTISPWFVTEGFASAAACITWHKAETVACAFGKNSLTKTANLLETVYNPEHIVILQEDDNVKNC